MGPSNKQNNGAISSSSTTPYQQLHSNNTIKASGDQSKVSATRPSTIATVTNTSARPSASPSGREALLRDEEGDNADYRLYMTERALTSFDTDESLSEEDKMVIQRLACRKFHMPGRTFWGDYCYWFGNNHPFLCFWLADPRHPLGTPERVMNLIASLAFGLAATCSVVLWFHYEETRDFNNVAFSVPGTNTNVTVGMLALVLFGGPLHVLFDLSVYFVQACPPCRVGGVFNSFPTAFQKCWLWIGAHVAFLITAASFSLAINVMLIRASINDGDGNDEDITTRPEHYTFMLLYLLEVFVANFIVFPIGTFTMFSGVLGCCGRIPGLGGRPYQVRKHQRTLERKALQEIRQEMTYKTIKKSVV